MVRSFLLFTAAFLISGCAGTNVNNEGNVNLDTGRTTASQTGQSFSDITRSKWILTTVFMNETDTQYRRSEMPAMQDYFTMNFNEQLISGIGAPNRFSAPYTFGDNQSISILPMRSTLMASFLEPDNLSEHQFYMYLQHAYEWRLTDDHLELLSRTDGQEIRLIFERGAPAESTE
ncbi:MAG: META domain-containing protein [Treponema sp.]|nr:META domain-containing protein [Treponema sp.]